MHPTTLLAVNLYPSSQWTFFTPWPLLVVTSPPLLHPLVVFQREERWRGEKKGGGWQRRGEGKWKMGVGSKESGVGRRETGDWVGVRGAGATKEPLPPILCWEFPTYIWRVESFLKSSQCRVIFFTSRQWLREVLTWMMIGVPSSGSRSIEYRWHHKSY